VGESRRRDLAINGLADEVGRVHGVNARERRAAHAVEKVSTKAVRKTRTKHDGGSGGATTHTSLEPRNTPPAPKHIPRYLSLVVTSRHAPRQLALAAGRCV
jgi:hypothetical protein